ncbi:MAG: radical protein [Thermodesulfobacteriota bacterium]|nr:radical protein [Thermodesulfobacteriota bacterium]
MTVGIRIYPFTELEATARKEGVVTRGDDLMPPKFYVANGLEACIRRFAHDAVAGWDNETGSRS